MVRLRTLDGVEPSEGSGFHRNRLYSESMDMIFLPQANMDAIALGLDFDKSYKMLTNQTTGPNLVNTVMGLK